MRKHELRRHFDRLCELRELYRGSVHRPEPGMTVDEVASYAGLLMRNPIALAAAIGPQAAGTGSVRGFGTRRHAAN